MVTYDQARIAVDAVLFTIHQNQLKVFLKKREKEPFKEKLELPGGLLRGGEIAERTLSRKIKEIIINENFFFQQFYTFTEPKRDPRIRTISIGFIALIGSSHIGDFSNWYSLNSIKDLAFDHEKIIKKAHEYLKKEINSLIVKQFLPDFFSLNRLQEAYEVIVGQKYDNRNFRRRMINSGIVEETKKIQKDVSHRPAKLYRFKKV